MRPPFVSNYLLVNTDKPKMFTFLVFVFTTASLIAQISSSENAPKRGAIFAPVAKQIPVNTKSEYFIIFFLTDTVNPNNVWMRNLPFFYFTGDCNDPNTQDAIKDNFLGLMTGPYVLPLFCKSVSEQCNKNTVQVFCGNVTAVERRRKRAATRTV